jgi:hypothetical protein
MNGTKGVAMSAGRNWIKEYYFGFLLLALSFLYLSHLAAEYRRTELEHEFMRLRHAGIAASNIQVGTEASKPAIVL